jgi:hypothetical protein
VPIGAVALPLAMRLLPDSYGAPERLDLLGVTLVTGGVVAIVWALVRANQSGWASAEIVSCLVSGAVLVLAFAAWEQRVSEPMVPLRLFRSRAFAVGNATTFLMTGAIFAAGFRRHGVAGRSVRGAFAARTKRDACPRRPLNWYRRHDEYDSQ